MVRCQEGRNFLLNVNRWQPLYNFFFVIMFSNETNNEIKKKTNEKTNNSNL